MCWDNQLYDAMVYVFNSGMNDYISPMEVTHMPQRSQLSEVIVFFHQYVNDMDLFFCHKNILKVLAKFEHTKPYI